MPVPPNHPPPEIPAREADDTELPRNARSLLRKAERLDLEHTASYSRGTDLNGTVLSSVLVRVAGPAFQSVALWGDGGNGYKYLTGYVWRHEPPKPRRIDGTARMGYRALVTAIEALAGER